MSHIGARIRHRRIELGFTQKELADAIGVGQSAVVQWESTNPNNRTEPKPKHYPLIASKLDVPMEWLVAGKGSVISEGDSPNQLSPGRSVAIIGVLGAGHWREPGAKMTDLPEVIPSCPVERYSEATQFCFAIKGDDLQLSYPNADWLYVVSLKETNHRVAPGDIVVIQASDGRKTENSVWKVTRNGSSLLLKSESGLRKDAPPLRLEDVDADPNREITHLAVGFAGHI